MAAPSTAAFGADVALLESELGEYVRHFTFPAVRVEFSEKSAAASIPRGSIRLEPRREEVRILLAQALMRLGEYEKATALLGPLIASGRTTEVRASARRVLGEMADRRAALAKGVAVPPITPPAPNAARPSSVCWGR